MSGNVNVNRQVRNFGTTFVTTRLFHLTQWFQGTADAVCPSSPEAEKNQIMTVNRFASLGRHKVEVILAFPRRDLWVDFTTHTQD
jgi:hypothetical protein